MKFRLGIITTHPIQYNAPLFKMLANSGEIQVKVFYTWENAKAEKFDAGFGKTIEWDIPLYEGYDYEFVKNTSKKQDSHHFFRIKNPDLNKKIVAWGANAILVYGWNFHSHLKAMMFFKGRIPVMFRGDSTLLKENNAFKSIARKLMLKFVYRFVDFAFYVGKNNQNYFLAYGLTKEQLVFAPHSIENERFDDKSDKFRNEAQKVRLKLGIPEHATVFLYAGKFEANKNPKLLIDAAIALGKEFENDVYFVLVGNGILETELKAEAKQKNIIFYPFQNQSVMPIVYRMGDVFVLPSKSETWGLAVNESLACSVPVLVSSKVGCADDLVKVGKNGYIFQSENVDELLKYIKLFLRNKENLAEMKKYSKDFIQKWSYQNCCKSIINHCLSLNCNVKV